MVFTILGFLLVAIGAAIGFIFGIILLVKAFQTHVLWGLGSLFVPFVALIFVIMHWDIAKSPFLRGLLAIPFYILGGICLAIGVPQIEGLEDWDPDNGSIFQPAEEEGERVAAADNSCSLMLPDNWSTLSDLNDEATLQVGNEYREEYLIILVDTFEEFDGTMKEHSDLTSSFIIEGLIESEDTGAMATTVNGYDAMQREIRGRISGLDISYLHTTVQGDNGFYQILAWTLAENESSKFPLFREVVDTFSEN